jgi:hypothetical protein
MASPSGHLSASEERIADHGEGDEEEEGGGVVALGQRLELELEGFLELQFSRIAEFVGDANFSYDSTDDLKVSVDCVLRTFFKVIRNTHSYHSLSLG